MVEETIRAIVADDSHFMRSVITEILEQGNISVVEQARDGIEAVEAVEHHQPDVVTMDVEMPEMDGITAVERIMATNPTPVLMLSAHTDDDAAVTFEALDNGAVDFFTKPGGEVSMEMSRFEDQLVDMVSSVATVGFPADSSSAQVDTTGEATNVPTVGQKYVDHPTLVIGSSTGGPKMVEQILAELPLECQFRILVVQHMPDGFTDRFADRIDGSSQYAVSEAADGDRIGGGEALVAPGGKHLVVSNYSGGRLRVKLTESEPVHSVRPAVDITMESASSVIDDELVGVVLTGMGKDGAVGIATIADAGGTTIAQDEKTSAVFGMPQRAIETGVIDQVLPIGEIPDGIARAVRANPP